MWTAPAFLDSLKTALEADTALMGYTPKPRIFTHQPRSEADRSDMIVFPFVRGSQEFAAIGQGSRDDSYTLADATIEIVRPLRQGVPDETVAVETRNVADLFLRRVIAVCLDRPATSLGQTLRCAVSRVDLLQGVAEAGPSPVMVALISFDVDVAIRVS